MERTILHADCNNFYASEVNQQYLDTPIRTGEVFPTNTVPIINAAGDRLKPMPCVWGFPKYDKNGAIINARIETVAGKKMFSESLYSRCCVVPSTGFYKWNRQKQKFFFCLSNENVLYMAGLYRDYGGERCFVILTTSANALMRDVHDRMPVILPYDMLQMWATNTGGRYIVSTISAKNAL